MTAGVRRRAWGMARSRVWGGSVRRERVAYGGVWGVPAIHRGQQTYSEPPLRQVVAHGELQELPEEDLLGEETVGKEITGGIFVGKRNCLRRRIMMKML